MKLSRKWLNEFVDLGSVGDRDFAEAMTLAMLSDSLVMPSMSSVSPLFSLVMISSEIFFAANISELTRAADEEFCSRRRASQFSSLAHLLTVASVSPVFAAITRCVSPLRNRRHA